MNKSTEFQHPVADLIRNRRSLRAFDPRPVEPEKIASLFEAARWAPSSSNEQPWMYIYATQAGQPDLWKRLFDCLNESNQVWAKNAPLIMISLVRKNFARNHFPNDFAFYDLGAANAFLSLQATDLGLQLRQIGGYSQLRAAELLNLPEDYAQGAMIAVGYPGDATALPEKLRLREESPRERVLQSAFIRNEMF